MTRLRMRLHSCGEQIKAETALLPRVTKDAKSVHFNIVFTSIILVGSCIRDTGSVLTLAIYSIR